MTTSRRRFMAGAAASPAALMAVGAGAAQQRGDHERPGDRLAPGHVRRLFSFSEDRVPMNAANLCPSPRPVAAALAAADADIDRDCSFQNRARFAELREALRRRLASQLGVSADEVALVRNTSEGNNVVNAGLDLEAGDEVVLWDENHPTNNVAWDVRAARQGLVVKRVSVPARPVSQDELIAPFEAAFGPRTRVLALSQVSNVSGLALPAAALAEAAHRRGIHVHVDGAQTWGVQRLDLAALGCDSFAASAHKWYMGPREVGLLYVRESAIDHIWPSVVAPGWGDDADPDPVGARKFESLGQRDDAAVVALLAAAELHDAVAAHSGADAVETYSRRLAERLKSGLVELGAELITPMEARFSGAVCIARVSGERRSELFRRLYDEHGIAGAATGGLRLCPHLYNTAEHVDRALAGVKALRHLLG